jgi:hypothetical protein
LRVPNTHVADEVKIAALRCTPPFSFLTFKVGDEVLKSMVQYEFDEGEVVMLKGDSESAYTFVDNPCQPFFFFPPRFNDVFWLR